MTRTRGVLSLGSNVGDRAALLQQAVAVIGEQLPCLRVSPVYETRPVGGPPQDNYLNAVLVTAADTAEELLAAAQRAERAGGRTRDVRWGPRTIDVDVVSHGATVRDDPTLTLPHPRAHERAFVLRPWLDVEPDAELVGRGRVADLLARLDVTAVRLRADVVLRCP